MATILKLMKFFTQPRLYDGEPLWEICLKSILSFKRYHGHTLTNTKESVVAYLYCK